ncbi:MAG: carbamoyltransferase [Planctomycetes bacterium]|nr:carbamoyltransferase [Planctomycetota bacterium]
MLVLGISCHYHDSAAALLQDGRIVAAAEEERFTRRKHDDELPENAVRWCLQEAGVTGREVDYTVFYEKPLVKFNRILESVLAQWPFTLSPWTRSVPVWLRKKLHVAAAIQDLLGISKEIYYSTHHLSHAASTFYVSGFDEAAVLTADGVGEWTTTAWGIGRGTELTLSQELRFPHSVGLLFSALTSYLGFQVNDAEWKVMGLAPYGRPLYVDRLWQVVDLKPDGSLRLDMKYFDFLRSSRRTVNARWEALLGRPTRPPEGEIEEFHRDVARSGQAVVEEILVRMARHVQRATGLRNLCLAGGVALNCVANWRIRQECGFDNVFIQPAAGDSGGALGAALYLYHAVLRQPRRQVMDHALFGPAFSHAEIVATLHAHGAAYATADDDEDLVRRTARYIAEGKVVGWFQGRMEFGPRALGSRSLLADPRSAAMKDTINAKVKYREAFRPFAPAVLKEHAHEWFDMPAGMDAPFMLLVPQVRPERRSQIPAVTHADGSARVQTVTAQTNPLFHGVLREFGRLTGVPVVLNTSFNVRGEPIVCTPQDAWKTFVHTGIDVLIMGRCIVTAKAETVDHAAALAHSRALEAGPRAAV